jgi:transposase
VNATGRRTYSEEYKRSLVKQCLVPGVSVAGMGLKYGINANLLRRWIRKEQATVAISSRTMLLPVALEQMAGHGQATVEAPARSSARADAGCIEIEVGEARIRIRGRVDVDALRCVLAALRST